MDRVSKAERELVRKMQRQTNADRIRSMTDDELAEWIGYRALACPEDLDWCPDCFVPEGCKVCWLSYLQKEVSQK